MNAVGKMNESSRVKGGTRPLDPATPARGVTGGESAGEIEKRDDGLIDKEDAKMYEEEQKRIIQQIIAFAKSLAAKSLFGEDVEDVVAVLGDSAFVIRSDGRKEFEAGGYLRLLRETRRLLELAASEVRKILNELDEKNRKRLRIELGVWD
jgi:hypothetical protein